VHVVFTLLYNANFPTLFTFEFQRVAPGTTFFFPVVIITDRTDFVFAVFHSPGCRNARLAKAVFTDNTVIFRRQTVVAQEMSAVMKFEKAFFVAFRTGAEALVAVVHFDYEKQLMAASTFARRTGKAVGLGFEAVLSTGQVRAPGKVPCGFVGAVKTLGKAKSAV
jgi:hypothetical protein